MREWVYFVGVGDGTLLYPDYSSCYRNLHTLKFLDLCSVRKRWPPDLPLLHEPDWKGSWGPMLSSRLSPSPPAVGLIFTLAFNRVNLPSSKKNRGGSLRLMSGGLGPHSSHGVCPVPCVMSPKPCVVCPELLEVPPGRLAPAPLQT